MFHLHCAGATARDLPVLSLMDMYNTLCWMGSDFHECPGEARAACDTLENSLHDHPQGTRWLAPRTPCFTCLPEFGRRWDTASLCQSPCTSVGQAPGANATDSPGLMADEDSFLRQAGGAARRAFDD